MLVKRLAFDGKHKIADRWEDDVYVILRQPNVDILVYEVQREDSAGRKRTLHRNVLLPVGIIAFNSDYSKDVSSPEVADQPGNPTSNVEVELSECGSVEGSDSEVSCAEDFLVQFSPNVSIEQGTVLTDCPVRDNGEEQDSVLDKEPTDSASDSSSKAIS